MSIRFLTPWGKYPANSVVTFDSATEASLVAAKVASTNLSGGEAFSDAQPMYRDLVPAQMAALSRGSAAKPAASSLSKRPTMMAFGTSITLLNHTSGTGVNGVTPYYAYLQFAQALMGNPWRWVDTAAAAGSYGAGVLRDGIFGWAGGLSAQIEPWFDQFVNQYKPDFCFIELTTNDTANGADAPAVVAARVLAKVDAVLAYGGTPIVFSGFPSTSINTSPLQVRYLAIHSAIEAGLALRPACCYVPVHTLYTDTSQAFGPQPLNTGIGAGFTDGVVHPRAIGLEIAAMTADAITARMSVERMVLPIPGSPQLLSANNLLGGASGAFGGITGVFPVGMLASTELTTAIVTGSKVFKRGKEAWQLDVTTSGAQTGDKKILDGGPSAASTGWSAGDMVGAVADIEFDPTVAMVGVRSFQVFCQFNSSATTYPSPGGVILGGQNGGDPEARIPSGRRFMLATPPVKVPASGTDNVTAIRPFIQVLASTNAASVACRFWVHSLSLINYSK